MSQPPIKAPRGPGWVEWPGTADAPLAPGARRFIRIDGPLGIQAVSSVDHVANDSGDEPGGHLEWHVSLTRLRRAPEGYVPEHATEDDVAFAIDAFRMRGCMEDNHARADGSAGVARNFWLAIDPAKRRDCECKTTEIVIVEPDGFTYTRPIREER